MELIQKLITILSACLVPTIAFFGVYFTNKTYKLARRKRQDDLFDRRYKFLKDFERLWKTTGPESKGGTKICLEWDDIEPYAQEAYYLFGRDIADHLRSYENKAYHQDFPWVPDSELAKPFDKYLCFENE